MDMINKIFKPLYLLAAIGWLLLAAFHLLSTEGLLIYLGVMTIGIGIRNLVILNVSYKTNVVHEKIQSYINRYGIKKGLIYYGILMILLYIIFGLVLILLNI